MKRFWAPASAIISLTALLLIAINNGQVGQQANVAAVTGNTTSTPTTGNLILNPSFEQGATNWTKGSWGSNTATLVINPTGHDSAHSATVTVSKYKSGDAKWIPDAVSAKAATSYTFSDWYESSVAGEIDAVVTDTAGKVSYVWLTSTPASTAWKQAKVTFNTPAKTSKITFYHLINKNGTLTTDDYDFELAAPATPVVPVIPNPNPNPTPPPVVIPPAPTAPTISITAPVASATIKGVQTITANVTDNQGIAKVQYMLDGKALGSSSTAPFSYAWDTTKTANGAHSLTAIATNTANLSTTSTAVSVTVKNPTPPTISITAPTGGSTVSGSQTATVSTADAQGMASVQYLLDGQPLGSPVTTAPYSLSWNTALTANGVHSLSAVATDIANLSTTSAAVSVTVFNQTLPIPPVGGTNSVPNPSVETVNPADATRPLSWTPDTWGTNTTTFSYLSTGHTGSHSTKVTVSGYANGSSDWAYDEQPVTPGHYRFTDWYQSDVGTEIDAAVTINGVVQYFYLGTVLPSAAWAQASAEFDVPAGATNISVFHLIAANGSLTTDDTSFGTYVPAALNRGIVSIQFDDGWTNQYTNALPLLKKYGQLATFFIISGELTDQPDYMSTAQVKALLAGGNEIGSHSVTHPDLTTLTVAQATAEMTNSKITLQNTLGVPITDFAYPFGAYNANTIAIGKTLYTSQRTVNGGFNTKDNMNFSQLLIHEVDNNITPAQVAAWVDQANAQHSWLILVFHEIAVTPTDPTDTQYDTQPSDLDAELNYIKSTGITVETTQQAINEIVPQL